MIQVTIKDPLARKLLDTATAQKSDTDYLANEIIKDYFANLDAKKAKTPELTIDPKKEPKPIATK